MAVHFCLSIISHCWEGQFCNIDTLSWIPTLWLILVAPFLIVPLHQIPSRYLYTVSQRADPTIVFISVFKVNIFSQISLVAGIGWILEHGCEWNERIWSDWSSHLHGLHSQMWRKTNLNINEDRNSWTIASFCLSGLSPLS